MNDLESRLRESLARQVTVTPSLPDLPDTLVRRGRRARHRRAGASVVAAIAVLAGGLVLAVDDRSTRDSLQPAARPSDAPDALAATDFLDGLGMGSGDEETVPYGIGQAAVFPGRTELAPGLSGTVLSVQRAGEGVVYLVQDGGRQQLGYLAPDGSGQGLSLDASGLAVDPTGTKVAFQPRHTTEVVVVSVPSGAEVVRRDIGVSGAPGAWLGAEVLLSATDGARKDVQAWNTVTGKVRVVGGADYTDVLGAVSSSDVVALTRSADGCVSVSYLSQRTDLWVDCDHAFVGFSPGGGTVLLRDARGLVVKDALTGDVLGAPAVPADGLLAAGLLDDETVLALNRYGDVTTDVGVAVTACPVSGGQVCVLLRQTDDRKVAWVSGSRP